jgi:hypothetical protein
MNDTSRPTSIRLPSRSSKMPHLNGTKTSTPKCPISHTPDPEDMEHDFTTPGKTGDLSCPFAKLARNNLPDTPPSHDPIAAEFHGETSSVASNGLGKCPIRFLDKHSPEEIAKYFENHKHEIPRSHEVCVRRYQYDNESARALDAKYGNLVNMIQGLGVKHKQYLPNGDEVQEQASEEGKVKKWAEDVSDVVPPSPVPETTEEQRQSHFERPLREIRVGESPTRPWGISVPVDTIAPSAMESDKLPIQTQSSPPIPEPPLNQRGVNAEAATSKQQKGQPSQIIFNGPVFFGYSPEDAAKLLRSLNVSNLGQPKS